MMSHRPESVSMWQPFRCLGTPTDDLAGITNAVTAVVRPDYTT